MRAGGRMRRAAMYVARCALVVAKVLFWVAEVVSAVIVGLCIFCLVAWATHDRERRSGR